MNQEDREYYKRSVAVRRSARKARTQVIKELGYDTQKVKDAALKSGVIIETSYSTVRGTVFSFSGHGVVTVDGKEFEVTGRRPSGNATYVSRMGYIEIKPIG